MSTDNIPDAMVGTNPGTYPPDDGLDGERYPTLSPAGAAIMRAMKTHPNAPLYRNRSGNRLLPDDLVRLRAFEDEVARSSPDWDPGRPPPWVPTFIERCYATVPRWRALGSPPADILDVPTTCRADLARDVASFVPDDIPVDRMINFRTTGTTGHPTLVPSLPAVAASYLAFHKKALRRFGVEPRAGRGRVGVVLVGWQASCFTYVSVNPTMDESGLAKINLDPADWRRPDDRSVYLEALDPEVLTGDPLSFSVLADLPVRIRPRALLSTSMTLLPGMRRRLEERFGCPVLDLYSLNESGPVAVADPGASAHVLLQHRLFVEILDADGLPVPAGARGEVTLTGGFNDCLPLLRYRTGDSASIGRRGPDIVLVGLEGRAPVRFRLASGAFVNNIDATHALRSFALPRFALRQERDGSLVLSLPPGCEDTTPALAAVRRLFAGLDVRLAELDPSTPKVPQYSSELPGAVEDPS